LTRVVAPSVAILARRDDVAAVALATLLRRRRCRVVLAYDHDLAVAQVVHRPSSGSVRGGTGASTLALAGDVVRLADGTSIDATTDVVVCRIATLAPARQASPTRQSYAEAEMFALALSWLSGLGDAVLNRPSPTSLAGADVDLLRLHRLAGDAGLAVPHLQLSVNAARGRVPSRRQRLGWTGPWLPRSAAMADPEVTGPPLPRPGAWSEPVQPAGTALVLGAAVHGAPTSLHSRLAVLAAAAGLAVCEIGLGHTASAAEPAVTGVSAVPGLAEPGRLPLLADFLAERGLRRRQERAA
jgi:hypothetical protein